MTTFQIKLIAITCMVIDHVGLFFFPQILLFRIVGRLAFPLFAWLIANGAYYSKNTKQYLVRLLFFALVAQMPFIVINRLVDPSFWALNILFTLFLGLAAIVLIQKSKNIVVSLLIVIVSTLIASILNVEYGAMGVLAIIVFYLSFTNFKKMIILQICIFTFFSITPIVFLIALTKGVNPVVSAISLPLCLPSEISACLKMSFIFSPNFIVQSLIEPLGLFSLIFVAFYSNQEGRKMKYFFYCFYPIHLTILYFIKLFV
ncbi:MAG TPA: TraX family protein [Ktedonobacteraceae bacterium]